MITVRRSEARGAVDLGWLDSRHTFSFGHYRDPAHMGFRALRVINEDRVAPGGGFPEHPHRDMEIITWVLEGALAHADSLGHKQVLRPGEVQTMTAGTGIRHSEFNDSQAAEVHLLQMWVLPERGGLEPAYGQKAFPAEERRGRLRLLVSPDGRDGSLVIRQDALLYGSLLAPGERVALDLAPGRHAWVQVARGTVELNGVALRAGDGGAVSNERTVDIVATADAEVLAYDLA